jgi:hypothetical protein
MARADLTAGRRRSSDPSGQQPQDDLQPVARLLAQLLDQAAQTHWYGYQRALQHANPERAHVLEERARRYEEMRDLCHAYMWQPKVRPRRLSVSERDELNAIFYRLTHKPEPQPRRIARTPSGNYGHAALYDECRLLATTPVGNRNNATASASFKIGRVVGAGLLDHDEAYSNLLGAAIACGLSERESRPVIRSGLRAGAQKLRPITEGNTA